MNAAYVGILAPGSTSRMRAERLRDLTPHADWHWIDTDPPFQTSARVWRTLAFRATTGAAVNRVNAEVVRGIGKRRFDLIWVDKAIFLKPATVDLLRRVSSTLVHFTPDAAFLANRSPGFEKTISLYDLLVTTKSFEIDEYAKRVSADRVMLTAQGYDPSVHFPRSTTSERRREAVFIGLAEPDRERCIAALLDRRVPVRLGGKGWQSFLRQRGRDPNLAFVGDEIFGDDYAEMLSRAWIGLGLLTKRIPELHTTRTFEIPACGGILATESTPDTDLFFNRDEAVFFKDYDDLAARVHALFDEPDDAALKSIASAGRARVTGDRHDYPKILGDILARARVAVTG